jgi:hypothetical protein
MVMRRRNIPLFVTLLLLGGLTAESMSRPKPKDAEPFHQRVRQVCDEMPRAIGEWVGTDIAIPPAAVALLRPNAIVHRRFVQQSTGRRSDFLLVQCRDARDMLGHYPPVCYPAHGWTQRSATPVEWQVEPKTFQGMEYEYTRVEEGQTITCVVSNLIILPDGRVARGMDDISKVAADYLRQFYGAAQIQIVVDAGVRLEARREIVSMVLGAHVQLLETLSSGGTR